MRKLILVTVIIIFNSCNSRIENSKSMCCCKKKEPRFLEMPDTSVYDDCIGDTSFGVNMIDDDLASIELVCKEEEEEKTKKEYLGICSTSPLDINLNNHSRKKVYWHDVQKPPYSLTSKSIRIQVDLMAALYRKLLYMNFAKRDNCGGWFLLSHKNFVYNRNQKVSSPKELGFKFISVDDDWDTYKWNAIRFVRDGSIRILSCIGRSGSFYVETKLKNTTNKTIKLNFKTGQVFSQSSTGIGKEQSLSVVQDYDYVKDFSKNLEKIFEKEYLIEYTIKSKEEKIIRLLSHCIDEHCDSPSRLNMYLTDLIDLATLSSGGCNDNTWSARRYIDNKENQKDLYEDLYEYNL